VLRYYLDLDVAEIAATLAIAPSAVRSTATRGLAALAQHYRRADQSPIWRTVCAATSTRSLSG
jgi:DNA-directed RNA polymerase specialized sigma24 family protein